MSQLPISADGRRGENNPKVGLARRLMDALERTIRCDGLFLVFLSMTSAGLGLFCAARWERADWVATALLRVWSRPLENRSSASVAELLVANAHNDLDGLENREAMNAALGQTKTAEEWEKERKRAVIPMGPSARLQWTAQEKQTALSGLEYVCQRVKSTSVALAKELHQQELRGWSDRIGNLDARLVQLDKTHQEFLAKNGIGNLKGDLAACADTITTLEYELRLDQQEEIRAKEEYKEFLRKKEEMKSGLSSEEQEKLKAKESQAFVKTLDKTMDLEMRVLGYERAIQYAREEIELEKKKRIFLQTIAAGKDAEYQQERSRLINEKANLETKWEQAERSGVQGALQIEWIQTPSVADLPLSTNRYQIFSSVFLSCSVLGFLGIYAWELRNPALFKNPPTKI